MLWLIYLFLTFNRTWHCQWLVISKCRISCKLLSVHDIVSELSITVGWDHTCFLIILFFRLKSISRISFKLKIYPFPISGSTQLFFKIKYISYFSRVIFIAIIILYYHSIVELVKKYYVDNLLSSTSSYHLYPWRGFWFVSWFRLLS